MDSNCMAEAKRHWANQKRQVYGIIIAIAMIMAITTGVHAMFRVEGVVTGIDHSNVTVTSFFRTQTVDLAGSPFDAANIKLGEKIGIQKNLQGNVLYVAAGDRHHGEDHGAAKGSDMHHR